MISLEYLDYVENKITNIVNKEKIIVILKYLNLTNIFICLSQRHVITVGDGQW